MRFTIRDLLWLTVVVALGVGWWQETRHRGPLNFRLSQENASLRTDIATDSANCQRRINDLNGQIERLKKVISKDREMHGWPWSYAPDMREYDRWNNSSDTRYVPKERPLDQNPPKD